MAAFLKESIRGVICNWHGSQGGIGDAVIPKGKKYLHFSGWNETINICEECLSKILREIKTENREEHK